MATKGGRKRGGSKKGGAAKKGGAKSRVSRQDIGILQDGVPPVVVGGGSLFIRSTKALTPAPDGTDPDRPFKYLHPDDLRIKQISVRTKPTLDKPKGLLIARINVPEDARVRIHLVGAD